MCVWVEADMMRLKKRVKQRRWKMENQIVFETYAYAKFANTKYLLDVWEADLPHSDGQAHNYCTGREMKAYKNMAR